MKQEINHNSWHMWLANFAKDEWTRFDIGDTTDICTYVKAVFWGTLRFIGVAVMVVALVSWTAFSVGNMFGWLFLDYKLEAPTVIAVFGFIVSVLLLAFAYGKDRYDAYRRKQYWKRIENGEHSKPRKPGFMALVYRKFKDKTCFKLEIK